MNDSVKEQAKAKLSALINQVLQDGVIDDEERLALQAFFRDALLGVSDVKEVYLSCVGALQTEVLADGVVTQEEVERCKLVVDQLKIPLRMLPPEMVEIVAGRRPSTGF